MPQSWRWRHPAEDGLRGRPRTPPDARRTRRSRRTPQPSVRKQPREVTAKVAELGVLREHRRAFAVQDPLELRRPDAGDELATLRQVDSNVFKYFRICQTHPCQNTAIGKGGRNRTDVAGFGVQDSTTTPRSYGPDGRTRTGNFRINSAALYH